MESEISGAPKADQDIDEFLSNLRAGQVAFNLFDFLPDVIFWIKDKEGRFVYVNDALVDSGSMDTKTEVMGKTDHDIFPVELASIYRSDDVNVMKAGEVLRNKAELVPNNTGGVEWRETSKIPLFDLKGDMVGTSGISRRMGLDEGRPGPSQHRVMNAIVGAIYKCVDQEIKVSELAEAANISVSTLERVFKQHMGTTPKKFILQAKISTSCERLIRTSKSVREIGESIGYPDHANYTRAFKKLMGVSPTRYKEIYKGVVKGGNEIDELDEITNRGK